MDLFSKRLFSLFEQNDEEVAPTPQTDREAMAQQLDTTSPQDYDVQQPHRAKLVDQHHAGQIKTLQSWVEQIDGFVMFLNDPNSNSIQNQLHAAPCDTVFQDIARSETKKLSRLAAELSTLSESLKGYMISSSDR